MTALFQTLVFWNFNLIFSDLILELTVSKEVLKQ